MTTYGMPGPGGSLGECGLCGKPFPLEIISGKRVQSFTMPGISDQTFYGHDSCLRKWGDRTFDVIELPAASAIRKAYERQTATANSSPLGDKDLGI